MDLNIKEMGYYKPRNKKFFAIGIGKMFRFKGKWCRVIKHLPNSFEYEFRDPTDADKHVQHYTISYWYWNNHTRDGENLS